MRNRTLIKNACLYGQTLRSIAITNGKIRRMLLPGSEHLFKAEHVIDLEGNYLFPGLIDIHTHGCKGMDTMDGNSLEELAHAYFKSGTTAWLPTTMTEALPRIREALRQPMPTPCLVYPITADVFLPVIIVNFQNFPPKFVKVRKLS